MASAAAEAFSPELVLVCPELRDRALQLVEPVWETVAREARTRPPVQAAPCGKTLERGPSVAASLGRFVVWQAAVVLTVGGGTLIMTLIANVLRHGQL